MPKWFKPKPPNYLKDGGKRKPLIILRNDQYKIDGNTLILKVLAGLNAWKFNSRGEYT